MSLNRHVCRRLLPRPQIGGINHVSIDGDIRDWALQRFILTRSFRRHVSLVPGPLEARKRATKRRLTRLAPSGYDVSAGHAGLQAGLEAWLFGGRRGAPQTYQWQKPSPPKVPAAVPLKDNGM